MGVYNEIFPKKFRATDGFEDPSGRSFNTLNLVKKNDFFNEDGDLFKIEYYLNYDEVEKEYEDISIIETRAIERNAVTGLPEKRATGISWYDIDGDVQLHIDLKPKIYTSQKAIQANERARSNLVEKSKEIFFMTILTNTGGNIALTYQHKNDFLVLVSTEITLYKESNIDPLITKLDETIINGNQNFRAYMTSDLVDALKVVLNRHYTS